MFVVLNKGADCKPTLHWETASSGPIAYSGTPFVLMGKKVLKCEVSCWADHWTLINVHVIFYQLSILYNVNNFILERDTVFHSLFNLPTLSAS